MTTARAIQVEPAATTMRDLVATEVRAWLGRRRISGAELARQMGKSQTWVARRLDGRQAFDVDDLEQVAAVLNLHVSDFFPSPDGRSVTHVCSDAEQASVIPFPLDRVAVSGAPDGGTDRAHGGTTVPQGTAGRVGENATAA